MSNFEDVGKTKWHRSQRISKPIYGRWLGPGDVLRAGDVYDSTSGHWESLPDQAGVKIGRGNCTMWIRPMPAPEDTESEASDD